MTYDPSYERTARKTVANGYPSLDSGGKVPSAQLPSASGAGTVIYSNSFLSQTDVLSSTVVTGAGLYLLSIYVTLVHTGTAGNLVVSLSYSDEEGTQTPVFSQVDLTVLPAIIQGTTPIRVVSGSLQFSTSFSASKGAVNYDLFAACIQLI